MWIYKIKTSLFYYTKMSCNIFMLLNEIGCRKHYDGDCAQSTINAAIVDEELELVGARVIGGKCGPRLR